MILWDLRKKKFWLCLAAAILVIALLALAFSYLEANHLISQVSKTVRLLPIYEVDTPYPQIAISFDASWGAEHTLEILDILDKHQVKTTFFLVNIWVEDYPDMTKEIAKRGHEIGLHSVTHPHFSQLSQENMEMELKNNFSLIKTTTGQAPILFRPPFGDYNNQVIKTSEALGYQPIQWSIDSLDWKDLSAQEIQSRVLKDISAGDIVLFHNNGKHTAEALEPILCAIEDKGLEVVPISELLLKQNWYIDFNGVQRAN